MYCIAKLWCTIVVYNFVSSHNDLRRVIYEYFNSMDIEPEYMIAGVDFSTNTFQFKIQGTFIGITPSVKA